LGVENMYEDVEKVGIAGEGKMFGGPTEGGFVV
jgi:hypothetical protein